MDDAAARWLFETDEEVYWDREMYGEFDFMPGELQQWWRDRIARKIVEASLLTAALEACGGDEQKVTEK